MSWASMMLAPAEALDDNGAAGLGQIEVPFRRGVLLTESVHRHIVDPGFEVDRVIGIVAVGGDDVRPQAAGVAIDRRRQGIEHG